MPAAGPEGQELMRMGVRGGAIAVRQDQEESISVKVCMRVSVYMNTCTSTVHIVLKYYLYECVPGYRLMVCSQWSMWTLVILYGEQLPTPPRSQGALNTHLIQR